MDTANLHPASRRSSKGMALSSCTRDLCPGAQTAAKMALEPARGMADYRLQCSRLWKQVARARNDFQRFRPPQTRKRLFVELDDTEIDAAHDQEGRHMDLIERVAGQVGTPTAGDDRAHPIAELGGGHPPLPQCWRRTGRVEDCPQLAPVRASARRERAALPKAEC